MPYSRIKQLWKGIKVLEKLKCMDLSHSEYLIETPNLSRVTNLERLVLEGCVSLCKVHSSLGAMKNLKFFSLKNCKRLKSLPSSTYDLKSLRIFHLSGCSKFEQFPENFGNLEMFEELYLEGTALTVPPSSFSSLTNFKILAFKGCKGPPSASWLLPRRSPNSILHNLSGLCSLTRLDLSDCNLSDEANLGSLGFLSSLRRLFLGGNNFVTLPNIIRLSHLQVLELNNCERLQELPDLPSSIVNVDARNCTSLKNVSHLVLKLVLANGRSEPPQLKDFGFLLHTLQVVSSGSRIPDWIRYQSSGSEVTAELPPNWFNFNFLGFGFSVVIGSITSKFKLPFYFPPMLVGSCTFFYSTSSHFVCNVLPFYKPLRRTIESDDLCLFYVPLPFSSNWPQSTHMNLHQVTHIRASFEMTCKINYQVKRCGIGLVYSNEDVNHNHPLMIQFSSISSPPLSPPPPPPPPRTRLLSQLLSLQKSMRRNPVQGPMTRN